MRQASGDKPDTRAVYDTVVYKYFRDPASGKFELFCGKITERGTDEGGEYVNVSYLDGDSEAMSLEACVELLLDQRNREATA